MKKIRIWLAEIILGKHGWVLGKSESIRMVERGTVTVRSVKINGNPYPLFDLGTYDTSTSVCSNSDQ